MTEITIEGLQAQIQAYKMDLVDPALSEDAFLEIARKISRISTIIQLLEQEKRLGIIAES